MTSSRAQLAALLSPRHVVAALRSRWNAERLVRQTVNALVPPSPDQFAAFGEGSVLVPPARVTHAECVHIGRGVVILENCWLEVTPQPGAAAPVLRIGDDTRMNRFIKIECASSVTIGRGVLVADRVYIGDVDLVAEDDSATTTARPIDIGDKVFLGVGAIVKPGVTIGANAYISAGSIVTNDVAEWTMVAGAPARAIRRWKPETS